MTTEVDYTPADHRPPIDAAVAEMVAALDARNRRAAIRIATRRGWATTARALAALGD